jgi:hypothetical protein
MRKFLGKNRKPVSRTGFEKPSCNGYPELGLQGYVDICARRVRELIQLFFFRIVQGAIMTKGDRAPF